MTTATLPRRYCTYTSTNVEQWTTTPTATVEAKRRRGRRLYRVTHPDGTVLYSGPRSDVAMATARRADARLRS